MFQDKLQKALYSSALRMFVTIGDKYKEMTWFSKKEAFKGKDN